MDEEAEKYTMWRYWRDKKGLEEALVAYFPNTLDSNMKLQVALAQLQNAEATINEIMAELSDKEEDEEDAN